MNSLGYTRQIIFIAVKNMIMQHESYNNQDIQPVTSLSLGMFSNVTKS